MFIFEVIQQNVWGQAQILKNGLNNVNVVIKLQACVFYVYCAWCNEQSTSNIICPADCRLRFLIYCCKSNESVNSLATLCLFPLDWHLWQDRKPSPDADVISLIESVRDTMPTLFQQIWSSNFDFTLFSSVVIRPSRSQTSQKVVCVHVMWECDWLEFTLTSFHRGKQSSPLSRCWACFVCVLAFQPTSLNKY